MAIQLSDAAVLALLWACVGVVVLGALALRGALPLRVALAVMLAKVALAGGFALLGDPGPWSLLDDIVYFRQGQEFLVREGNPFDFFLHPDRVVRLVTLSQGLHILYGWYNYLAQWLVGPYYFAPVIGNVLLTAVAAAALFRLVSEAGVPIAEARWTTLAFLLHWDVLAWSSFVNVKDNLVVTLTLLLLLAYSRLARGITRGRVVAIVVVSGLFVFLRFYVPVLALGAFVLTSASARSVLARHRWRLLALGAALAAGLFAALGPGMFALALSYVEFAPGTMIFGVVRILLTPQPWSLESNYEYLLLPSTLHMLFIVPGMAGLWALWRHVPAARLGVAYYALIVLVFASFPRQQGPRHRYQAVFMLVWGLVHLAREAAPLLAAWLRGPAPAAVAGGRTEERAP